MVDQQTIENYTSKLPGEQPPVILVKERNVHACSAGEHHSMYICNGELFTFGSGRKGRLGHGCENTMSRPQRVTLLADLRKHIVQISAGTAHSACVTSEGELYLWGEGDAGQTGMMVDTASGAKVVPAALFAPKLMDLPVIFKQVACGMYHTVALTVEGKVYSWGWAAQGRLGVLEEALVKNSSCPMAKYGQATTPQMLETLYDEHIIQVETKRSHTACVSSEGAVYTWGEGSHFQLGHGGRTDETLPRKVQQLEDLKIVATQVAVSADATACVSADGRVWTWGAGTMGQLGHGTLDSSELPHELRFNCSQGQPSDSKVCSIACGQHHMTCVDSAGTMYAWGKGEAGENGSGQLGNVLEPLKLMEGVAQVSAGKAHSLCVDLDGQLWSWGDASYGQLGYSNTAEIRTPRNLLKPTRMLLS